MATKMKRGGKLVGVGALWLRECFALSAMTMTIAWTSRLGALLGAAAVVAIAARAADQSPTIEPAAGELLVASDDIGDPRFYHAVILIVHHSADGAFGVVINHPLGERPLSTVLADTHPGKGDNEGEQSRDDAAIPGTIPIFLGGPVQPQLGFVLHGIDYRLSDTIVVSNTVAVTANKQILRDIGRHHGPAKYLFAIGRAGWGPGQLDDEIAHHVWFTEPSDLELVFDADRATVWDRAYARRTREL
jgi:putative transcriptional regulator